MIPKGINPSIVKFDNFLCLSNMEKFFRRMMSRTRIVLFTFLLVFAIFFVFGQRGLALDQEYQISGELKTQYGTPIRGCDVMIKIVNGPTYEVTSNSSGYYHFDSVPLGAELEVWLMDGSSFEVKSTPWVAEILPVTQDVTQDFEVYPGVVVVVDGGYYLPRYEGAVAYCNNTHVATFGSQNRAVFYPDQFGFPHTGYSSVFKPFHKFSPQSQGVFSQYDCRNFAISYVNQVQTVSADLDISADYSWDDPGGMGYEYFPATPDNRLPNNPNVYVEADFDTKGTWPANRIKLNGVISSNDLDNANGHIAEFTYPIPPCGPLGLQVEVQYLYGYGYKWEALATQKASGASDANLYNDDGLNTINIRDLVEFQSAFMTCEGDTGYLPCADYIPSGCIDLLDLTDFSIIYFTDPNKNGEAASLHGDVWLSGNDDTARDCIFKTDGFWDVAIIRFQFPNIEIPEIRWAPSRPFVDRSVLVSHESGGGKIFSLFILGSNESETTVLGRLSSESSGALSRIEFISSEIGSLNKSLSGPGSPSANLTSLGDATPNPFNPKTSISFDLPRPSNVKLSVFDVAGRLVRTLVAGDLVDSGHHEVDWNGKTDTGAPVAGGVYFYRLDAGQYSATKRMTLLK